MDPVETRLRLAARISDHLSADPQVNSVFLFGSAAYGVVSRQSDIDLMVVCDPEIPSRSDRSKVLSKLASGWMINTYGFKNTPFPVIDVHKKVDGVMAEVHYQTSTWFQTVISEVLTRGCLSTATCPFRPYTVIGMIQTCRVLYDPGGLVDRWLRQTQTYPQLLKQNLLDQCVPALQQRVAHLSDEKKYNSSNLRDALDEATSLILALNDVYDPSHKKIDKTILPELGKVPDRFLERWTEARYGQGRESHTACIELCEDVLKMADQAGKP